MSLQGECTNSQSNPAKESSFHDILDNSFSNLEEEQLGKQEDECQQVMIDIHEQESDEALIKQPRVISMSDVISDEEKKAEGNKKQSGIVALDLTGNNSRLQIPRQEFDQQIQKVKSIQEYQEFEEKYLEKIKVIYAFSLLGSERISLSNIRRLKTFLFVPKHGEDLVRWGNQRYGTNYTPLSALERLQHLQHAQCDHYTVKCKQNARYILALLFCIVILKIMI